MSACHQSVSVSSYINAASYPFFIGLLLNIYHIEESRNHVVFTTNVSKRLEDWREIQESTLERDDWGLDRDVLQMCGIEGVYPCDFVSAF